MTDLAGPGPSWSDEIVKLERKIREGEPMDLDRYQTHDGHWLYRIHSSYDLASIAMTPKELMALLAKLQELEQQLIQDALDNDVRAGMREIERDE